MEFCPDHSKNTSCIESCKAQIKELWHEVESRVKVGVFYFTIGAFLSVVGAVFATQWSLFDKVSIIASDLKVMQTDITYMRGDIETLKEKPNTEG